MKEFKFNVKTEIDNLASEILSDILGKCYFPEYLTPQHKEKKEHFLEFQHEFMNTLNHNQRKDYLALDAINNATFTTDIDYSILFGMRIKSALDEIMKNPLKILNLYESKAASTRDLYKSVKQKEEELCDE